MQGDVEFLLSLSYYLELNYGILHKPIAMQGVHDRCKVLWAGDKETIFSYADLERNKQFLNWFINLQTLKSLTR
ncbi:hypothetical protein SAMN06265171_105223 [Chryseobacterium rhizoplanae]|uniref:Uncharacterized protein n=2 Tax=Chryseobacterium rhizoplanae TaxID=1609531 RepID=A0A521DMV3_9FLAO|nr:hypothetical protein SAMN06265171_105223 [Chryseobacterium rhizoplanae]